MYWTVIPDINMGVVFATRITTLRIVTHCGLINRHGISPGKHRHPDLSLVYLQSCLQNYTRNGCGPKSVSILGKVIRPVQHLKWNGIGIFPIKLLHLGSSDNANFCLPQIPKCPGVHSRVYHLLGQSNKTYYGHQKILQGSSLQANIKVVCFSWTFSRCKGSHMISCRKSCEASGQLLGVPFQVFRIE